MKESDLKQKCNLSVNERNWAAEESSGSNDGLTGILAFSPWKASAWQIVRLLFDPSHNVAYALSYQTP
jgi:hypothetical protein